MAMAASRPGLNPLDNLMGNHIESYAPQASFEASSTPQYPLGMVFAREKVVEFDAAMEVDTEIEANLCRTPRCVARFTTND